MRAKVWRLTCTRVLVTDAEGREGWLSRVYGARGDDAMYDYSQVTGKDWYLIRVTDEQPRQTIYGPSLSDWWVLSEEPGRTNQSHEERVTGWLGTTNGVCEEAVCRVRAVSWTRDGRIYLRAIKED